MSHVLSKTVLIVVVVVVVYSVINPKAFVPVHLYGQLAQHAEGCALLEKEVSKHVPPVQ